MKFEEYQNNSKEFITENFQIVRIFEQVPLLQATEDSFKPSTNR